MWTEIYVSGRSVSYHLQLETLLGAFCCPVPQTLLLLTRIYQHFYTTESPNIRGQRGVCAATSAAKQFAVTLVHEKTFRDLGSGLTLRLVLKNKII